MATLSNIITPSNVLTASNTVTLTNKTIAFGSNTLTDVASTNTSQTLTNKTLASPTINDGYTEEIFAVTGTTPALAATNGSIQTWTLSANSTPTDSISNGQSILLGVTAGSFTVTWPTTTWSKVGGGGAAPTLTSTGVNWIVFWKVGGTLRGSLLGTA
jgi:hypothetical protein